MAMNIIPADEKHRIAYMYDEEASGIRNGKPWHGLVIAMMDECGLDAIFDLNAIFDLTDKANIEFNFNDESEINPLLMNDTYKGIAYCSVDDAFDLKQGMHIARDRMLAKYYKGKRKVFKNLYKNINSIDTKLSEMIASTYKE